MILHRLFKKVSDPGFPQRGVSQSSFCRKLHENERSPPSPPLRSATVKRQDDFSFKLKFKMTIFAHSSMLPCACAGTLLSRGVAEAGAALVALDADVGPPGPTGASGAAELSACSV